jgi:hypothetical protein
MIYFNKRSAVFLVTFSICIMHAGVFLVAFSQSTVQTNSILVSSKSVPYATQPGTFETITSLPTPYGDLSIHANVNGSTVSYIKNVAPAKSHFLLAADQKNGLTEFSFYGQNPDKMPDSATVFSIGDTYYMPIEGNPGGNCDPGNDIYVIKWGKTTGPVASQLAGLDECLEADYVRPTNSGLDISVLSADSLKIANWLYDWTTGNLTVKSPKFYQIPTGFLSLVSSKNRLVKTLSTRYGNLALDPSGILFNGAVQNFPNDNGSDYNGFASKVFQDNDTDVVVAELIPDQATGLVFQIISISDGKIALSPYFGSGFEDLSYQMNSPNLQFAVGGYTSKSPTFADQKFQWENGNLVALDAQSTLVPSNTLPANLDIVQSWYVLMNSDGCEVATASPANLIEHDKENGLQDIVSVLVSDSHGAPVAVKVGEPEPGDLEDDTFFFRGYAVCDQYVQNQNSQINQLK